MITSHKNLKELLSILNAIKDGIPLEWKKKEDEVWELFKTGEDREYNFNFSNFEFRIKPESQLVPFSFEDAEFLIGKAVKGKDSKYLGTINMLRKSTCVVFIEISYECLLEEFTFLDGSPCGKLVETSNK